MKQRISVDVRFAEPEDLDFCIRSDYKYKYVSETMIKRKIEERTVILAEVDGKPIGYLRIEYLWLKIPYISLITVSAEYRRKGVGTAMINFLEEYLSRNGHKVLYSSSQVDEPGPQMWHRKMGFEECGYVAGINEGGIGEIFFRKFLKN
ncbi:MAG: GNAT family N-acetyltransferase [Candidatus Bathyarchaeia archaeon]